MAEGARLESVFTRKGNVGSNPTLSAMRSFGDLGDSKVLRCAQDFACGLPLRLAALTSLTPAKRLKFESHSLRQSQSGSLGL